MRTLRKLRIALLALAITALTAGGAGATIIVNTLDPVIVDNTFVSRFFVTSSETILNVSMTLDFAKCNSTVNLTGCTGNDGGSPFFNEIGFSLESPSGTVVNLIPVGSWASGSAPNFSGIIMLDDSGALVVNFDVRPQPGIYRPVNPLSAFIGEDSLGTWELVITDSVGQDPLVYRAGTLAINAPIPEPGAVTLFGTGFLVTGLALRRRIRR